MISGEILNIKLKIAAFFFCVLKVATLQSLSEEEELHAPVEVRERPVGRELCGEGLECPDG